MRTIPDTQAFVWDPTVSVRLECATVVHRCCRDLRKVCGRGRRSRRKAGMDGAAPDDDPRPLRLEKGVWWAHLRFVASGFAGVQRCGHDGPGRDRDGRGLRSPRRDRQPFRSGYATARDAAPLCRTTCPHGRSCRRGDVPRSWYRRLAVPVRGRWVRAGTVPDRDAGLPTGLGCGRVSFPRSYAVGAVTWMRRSGGGGGAARSRRGGRDRCDRHDPGPRSGVSRLTGTAAPASPPAPRGRRAGSWRVPCPARSRARRGRGRWSCRAAATARWP